jgi:hypothetical protein
VLRLVSKKYSGEEGERFGPTLAAEHLASDDHVEVNAQTLRRWMLSEGLWSRARKRRMHRKRRERKAHVGELVQMDGSFHDWLEERGPRGCLMNMVDDASGDTLARMGSEETIWAAAGVLRAWAKKYGIPVALYTDWKNVYVREASTKEQLQGVVPVTQFGQMCQRLGIRIIAANSPQAKGRVERNHGTHQDRLPSELLARRPDIAAAERRVASANAQIGVAKSAYYPLISLGASGGFESSAITTLLNGPSGLWSVGLSAVGTVFDVGRRRSLNDQARAAYDYQVAAYRENVLTGFQQVEDNLAAVRILENEAKVQDEAVAAAQRSLELSTTRYKGGVTSYLEVITAQSAALADEVTAVNILGRRMASTVLLIQALGGGWDRSSLPERPECCGQLVSSTGSK